ncbi:MAG: helix-hairpin-helix domain-containing protein [Acidobacteria bacterium]|nr:helix-hairpin-helix domain-containing protein [Acidobacteriota bacterium]
MKKTICSLSVMLSIAGLCLALLGAAQAPEKPAKAKDPATADKSVAKKPEKPVDINNATEKELITLPGVGAKVAKEIVAGRPFKSVEDLKNVKGIGDKTFAALKPHVVCNPAKK